MIILILHLSDIHLNDGDNPIIERQEKILSAVQAEFADAKSLLCLVTGDIASSGKESEYSVAKAFFSSLKEGVSKQFMLAAPFIFVPGNHDCEVSKEAALRQSVIAGIKSSLESISFDDTSVCDECTKVQDNYYKFVSSVNGEACSLVGSDRLHFTKQHSFDSCNVSIECFNTAWISQRQEKQGQLFYPSKLLETPDASSDLVISIFHHPYNWLEADNARAFRKNIERRSDIILTGHEHEATSYTKTSARGEYSHYVEGAVLQTTDPYHSGFNILKVDLTEKRWKAMQYEWEPKQQLYVLADPKSSDWQVFERSKHSTQRQFDNTLEYANYLLDAGAEFTHPKSSKVRLDDLYVYPDLSVLAIESKKEETVRGNSLLQYVLDTPRLLIIGQERSGKTALAKTLYKALQQKGMVPVLLEGSVLRGTNEEDLIKITNRAFENQYLENAPEKYRQLSPVTKVLIIDDLQKTLVGRTRRDLLLAAATRVFGHVVIFADDIFHLREFANATEEKSSLLKFRHCRIKELGHERRGKLIEKWYSIGQETLAGDNPISQIVPQIERTVNTLLGRNILPAHPIFILAILQTIESQSKLDTAAGAYGYIYEALITAALAKTSKKTSIDTKYTYISLIAYEVFKSEVSSISEESLHAVNQRYFEQYKVRVSSLDMVRDLLDSSVLLKVEKEYRFKYQYLYYYFVARYFKESLQNVGSGEKRALRKELTAMTKRVYNEDAANILIFFIYLTKDSQIIAELLKEAKGIFPDQIPCDLDKDIEFLLAPKDRASEGQIAYYETDPKEGKTKYLQSLDASTDDTAADPGVETDEEKELNEFLRVNVAFKTVQIMGQILRNYPGSLKGKIKLNIARECYSLGLRALQVIYRGYHGGIEALKTNFKDFLKEKGITKDSELDERADQFFYWIGLGIGFSTIKQIAQAVGSDQLEETYVEVAKEQQNPSFVLIDAAIKLDHKQPFPKKDLLAAHKKLESRVVPNTLLKALVVNHLYIYDIHYKEKQNICEKLQIPMKPRKLT